MNIDVKFIENSQLPIPFAGWRWGWKGTLVVKFIYWWQQKMRF